MNRKEMKKWIDNATYEQLFSGRKYMYIFRLWFPFGIGKYYEKMMKKKHKKIHS